MIDQKNPLAVRMRPKDLNEVTGQEHILGKGKILQRVISSQRVSSLILWGPVGCGKTSLGFIVAKEMGAQYQYINAAFSSVAQIKKILKNSRDLFNDKGRRTALFIDEIHRFNKLQQESLVPDTEAGTIILIGTTIHNPHYYLIASLISRSVIAGFKPLTRESLLMLLKRSLKDKERGLGEYDIEITNKALEYIAISSNGDARSALTALEIGVVSTEVDKRGKIIFDLSVAKETIQKKNFHDRVDGYHYDTISAFIKSIRGSDADSALFWLAKMLKGGEDPRFIARRLTILASEDIGNANPFALVLATNCFKAVEFIGMPEAQLILAQTVIYLAGSQKSNSAYLAIQKANADIENHDGQQVPDHIKTHSKDYKYPHSFGGYVKQDYGAKNKYYFPKDIGEEKKIKAFFEHLEEKKKK